MNTQEQTFFKMIELVAGKELDPARYDLRIEHADGCRSHFMESCNCRPTFHWRIIQENGHVVENFFNTSTGETGRD